MRDQNLTAHCLRQVRITLYISEKTNIPLKKPFDDRVDLVEYLVCLIFSCDGIHQHFHILFRVFG